MRKGGEYEMLTEIFKVVGKNGVIKEQDHKPSSYVKALTSSEDGTNIQEVWLDPNKESDGRSYWIVDETSKNDIKAYTNVLPFVHS